MSTALFLSWSLLALMSSGSAARAQEKQNNTFLVLTIDNKVINPVIADYVSDGIEKGENEGYAGVIIRMDTPGGLLESTRAIVKKIMNAGIPVIVYVAPSGSRAGSAGVFITLASHVAAMAPSTNIGAAHPVTVGPGGKNERSLKKAIEELTDALKSQKKKDRTPAAREPQEPKKPKVLSENPLEEKVLNDTLAWIETIAKNRSRNADWARTAVEQSVSITEKEAFEKKVIDLIAVDMHDLLKKIDGKNIALAEKSITLATRGAGLDSLDLTLPQKILNTIIDPNIAYILLLAGFLGLFIEITHPGVYVPGIIGVISLIVAFYAFSVLPINFAGVLLIILAIILFVAEALTPATFGVLTLAGAVCMLLGSLMLINSPFSGLAVSLKIILPFVFATAAIVIFLAGNVFRAHRKKVLSGTEALIGQTGTASTDILEEGQTFVAGELWTAVNASAEPIRKGEKIKVVGVDKIKLIVSKY